MLYQAYQAQSDIMVPVRMLANMASSHLGGMLNGSAGAAAYGASEQSLRGL